jgi:hypothetical protein
MAPVVWRGEAERNERSGLLWCATAAMNPTRASRCPTRPVGAESNDRDLIFWRVSYWSSLARSPPPCPPHHHRQNDPHNFGTLPAAMVAVWQIETFDNWEDIMQTNM